MYFCKGHPPQRLHLIFTSPAAHTSGCWVSFLCPCLRVSRVVHETAGVTLPVCSSGLSDGDASLLASSDASLVSFHSCSLLGVPQTSCICEFRVVLKCGKIWGLPGGAKTARQAERGQGRSLGRALLISSHMLSRMAKKENPAKETNSSVFMPLSICRPYRLSSVSALCCYA